VSPLAVFRGCFLLLAVSSVVWALAGGRLGLLHLSALVAGTGYGGVAGIAPSIVARAHGTVELGATLGLLYTALGIGGLVTGPAVGAIVDQAGYRPAFAALAGLAVAGALLLPGARRAGEQLAA
jgi:MFS family permease